MGVVIFETGGCAPPVASPEPTFFWVAELFEGERSCSLYVGAASIGATFTNRIDWAERFDTRDAAEAMGRLSQCGKGQEWRAAEHGWLG